MEGEQASQNLVSDTLSWNGMAASSNKDPGSSFMPRRRDGDFVSWGVFLFLFFNPKASSKPILSFN